MQMADRHLISKCLDGDSSAFGMLVDRYKESVYALAYSKLYNFHDAEDITQEAFIKAYQNLRKLRRWDEFHAWIYAITNNLCKDWIRAKSRQPDCEFIEDQPDKLLDQYSSESPYNNMVDQLHEALESLPDTYQQVLTLHYLGGMDGVEIAKFLGVSPTSIWQRLSRARSLLKKEMLDMMSETFEQNRLKAGFTFHVIEMVKRIRINPMPPKTLPWGLSLATGIILAVLGIGTHINVNNNESYLSGSATGESKVLNVGEFPVDVAKASDVAVMSNQFSIGNGLGSIVPSLQNALFMAPQAEGGTWTKKADMPTARMCLSPNAGVVNEKLYIIGRYDDNDKYVSTCEEYDPTTDKWTKKANMPTARGSLSTCAMNGKIYAFGGWTDNAGIELSAVEEYDPAKDKWTKKAGMPTGRQYFSANTIGDKIYVIGGWRGGGVLSMTEEYDPVEDKWTKKADMPNAKYGFSTSVANGKIYVIGGCSLGGIVGNGGAISTVEEYDPTLDKWAKKSEMPTARMFSTANEVNGKIYTIGGILLKEKNDYTPMVEEYDPATDEWTKKADMPTMRSTFSSGVVNGKIYVIGGNGGAGGTIVEEYDPGTSGQGINFKGKLPTTWGEVRTALNR